MRHIDMCIKLLALSNLDNMEEVVMEVGANFSRLANVLQLPPTTIDSVSCLLDVDGSVRVVYRVPIERPVSAGQVRDYCKEVNDNPLDIAIEAIQLDDTRMPDCIFEYVRGTDAIPGARLAEAYINRMVDEDNPSIVDRVRVRLVAATPPMVRNTTDENITVEVLQLCLRHMAPGNVLVEDTARVVWKPFVDKLLNILDVHSSAPCTLVCNNEFAIVTMTTHQPVSMDTGLDVMSGFKHDEFVELAALSMDGNISGDKLDFRQAEIRSTFETTGEYIKHILGDEFNLDDVHIDMLLGTGGTDGN